MAIRRTRGGNSAVGTPRSGTRRLVAIAAVLGVLITGTLVGGSPNAAWAIDYPTWADVANARNNEAATQAAVTQIEGLLAGLQAEAARTQADADAKGTVWQEADTKYQAAAARAATLQAQADAANAVAKVSEQRAGQMAAQLMRAGGGDLTAKLFTNSGNAESLLYGLGMSSKISEQANAIYNRALQDKNTAQSLTDQADVAKNELKVLKEAAEKAFIAAQAAAVAASAALQEQQNNQARLQQQLIVLREKRAATEADYLAGVRARIAAAASLDAGEISLSGWVRPASGSITSTYGWRILFGAPSFHKGTDLANSCGTNIYAASSGVVSYAAEGWNGGYGNYIIIDHGNGVNTAYGHIRPGGILVTPGQSVGVGTNIAKMGSTGLSTGCHLHFEVRLDGTATDPVPFMQSQGITIG